MPPLVGDGRPVEKRAASTELPTITAIELGPIRPNPFHGQMSFRIELPQTERVRLVVFDLMGRRVRTLADGPVDAGSHDYAWDARDDGGRQLEAGMYLVQLETPGFTTRRKAVLAR